MGGFGVLSVNAWLQQLGVLLLIFLTIEVAMDLNQNDPVEMYRREVSKVQPLTDEEQTRFFLARL